MSGRPLVRHEARHPGPPGQVRGLQRRQPRWPRHSPGRHGGDRQRRGRHPHARPGDAGPPGGVLPPVLAVALFHDDPPAERPRARHHDPADGKRETGGTFVSIFPVPTLLFLLRD